MKDPRKMETSFGGSFFRQEKVSKRVFRGRVTETERPQGNSNIELSGVMFLFVLAEINWDEVKSECPAYWIVVPPLPASALFAQSREVMMARRPFPALMKSMELSTFGSMEPVLKCPASA